MTIRSITQNYDLSPEPKTEPTPLVSAALPERETSHQLLKDLIRHVKNDDWIAAKDLYTTIPDSEKAEIEKLIFERILKTDPTKIIPFAKIEEVINDHFEILNTPGANQESAFNFLNKLFIPSVYDHLIETFEFKKSEAISKNAEEAFEAVRARIILSPNFANRDHTLIDYLLSRHSSNLQQDYIATVDKVCDYLEYFVDLQRTFFAKQPKMDDFLITILSSQMHEDSHLGNCGDISNDAFDFLKNKAKRIECARIIGENGDHQIDIINRKQNSERTDFMTWGRHCKVLDIWTDEPNLYPAHDIPLFLKDYKGLDVKRNPVMVPFDPDTQKVELGVSNLYSSSDLNELFLKKPEDLIEIKWIRSNLEKFENSTSKVQKTMIANEIIDKVPKFYNKSNKQIAKTLINQLKIYLNPDYVELYNVGPKNNRPVFECAPCEDLFKNYLCSTTVDHLVKIANLYQERKIKKADKKFEKLTALKKEIRDHFFKSPNDLFDNRCRPLRFKAKIIYAYLIDKMKTAEANQKHEIARKIYNKIPESVRKNNPILK